VRWRRDAQSQRAADADSSKRRFRAFAEEEEDDAPAAPAAKAPAAAPAASAAPGEPYKISGDYKAGELSWLLTLSLRCRSLQRRACRARFAFHAIAWPAAVCALTQERW
jgi:hypothetical protein